MWIAAAVPCRIGLLVTNLGPQIFRAKVCGLGMSRFIIFDIYAVLLATQIEMCGKNKEEFFHLLN